MVPLCFLIFFCRGGDPSAPTAFLKATSVDGELFGTPLLMYYYFFPAEQGRVCVYEYMLEDSVRCSAGSDKQRAYSRNGEQQQRERERERERGNSKKKRDEAPSKVQNNKDL